MKRLIVFLLVLVSVIAIAALANAETYIVNTESEPLNIRSVEDSSIILGGIRKGKTIEIDYHDKFWGYFTYGGIPAKVYMEYLIPASAAPSTITVTTSTSTSSRPKKDETPRYVSEDEATLIYHVTDKIRSHINVRVDKSESAEIIGCLEPGERVLVVAKGKTWTRIIYNNQYAFVYSKYLVDLGDNLPEGGELYKVKVATNTTLNVRKEATKKAKVLTKISNGSFVKVFERQNTWSFVYYTKTDFGYVMNKFLEKVE